MPDSPGVRLALSRFVVIQEPAPAGKRTPSSQKLPKRIPLTEDQIEKVNSLPKNSGKYLSSLFTRGLDINIVKDAEMGLNPFCKDNARPYNLAFDRLMTGRIARFELRACFVEELGWKPSAAKSQASIVWDIFLALGIAQERGCFLIPAPMVSCKNNVIQNNKVSL